MTREPVGRRRGAGRTRRTPLFVARCLRVVGDQVVHLFSGLPNFEPPQCTSAPGVPAAVTAQTPTRADLHKLADGLHAELAARYTAGETVKALAAEHGLHHQTVRAVLVKTGTLVRTRRRLTQAAT
jgi:hypothetical protein